MTGGLLLGGLSAAAGAAGLYLSPHAYQCGRRELSRLSRRSRSLVLTFDDGPGPGLTPRVLEALSGSGAKATFFLLGFRAERSPEVVAQVVAEGHEVGSHSQNHLHAWRSWPWRLARDIEEGFRTIGRWAPAGRLFRPPYGKVTAATLWALRGRGARLCGWTLDSGDTGIRLPRPEEVVEAVQRAGGGVVLLHDFDRQEDPVERADFVVRTTRLLLEAASREGMRVRTLGALLAEGGARG